MIKTKLLKRTVDSKLLFNSDLEKPECQRLLDDDQVNKIYNYQMEHYRKHGE